jgi:hypothetical protein
MISLVNIAKGWYNLATSQHQELALKRLKTCDTCEFKRQMNPAGALLVTMINHSSSVYYCGDCGCPLAAKVSAPNEACGKRKWPAEPDESYY